MAICVKRGLVFGVLSLGSICLGSASSYAASYGMAGCGLGSIIISPSGSQTSAATSNGVAYSQLFGITSGTSNCKTAKEMATVSQQEDFVALNLGTLSKEMAQGSGESLMAFSETLGCDQNSFSTVANTLQANYQTIFMAPGAMAVLDSSKGVLKANPELATRCQYLN